MNLDIKQTLNVTFTLLWFRSQVVSVDSSYIIAGLFLLAAYTDYQDSGVSKLTCYLSW
jgi:hypothetical protein